MLKRLLQRLENPELPFLGPNVLHLKFTGMLLTGNFLKDIFLYFAQACLFCFVVTEWIDIWVVRSDLDLVLINFKLLVPLNLAFCKSTSFVIWQNDWKSIIEYVTAADKKQRNSDDDVKKKIINDYTKYSRKITYLFIASMYATIVVFTFLPFFKYWLSSEYRENIKNGKEPYMEIARSWVPFDKSTIPGYLAVLFIQAISVYASAGRVISYDTTSIAIMVFFKAELQMLKRDSALIFGTESQMLKDEDAMERIKDCHKRHIELSKFASMFNSCLSPIVFLYMFVMTLLLCVIANEIASETSAIQMFLVAEYFCFSMAEMFMYSWHSNEVLYMSYDLMEGPYESIWWATDVKMRKNVYILTAQFSQKIEFSAGPFAMLNNSTFVSVVKGAYSYYALLRQAREQGG